MPLPPPSELSPDDLKKLFPDLDSYFWKRHSDTSRIYNCIAFAAGDTKNWWEPSPLRKRYWPKGVPRVDTVAAYTAAFKTRGFELCTNGTLEIGFDKIVLYLRGGNFPCHAAKQISTGEDAGFWLSKLGENIDIIHEKPESLSGHDYGVPTYFFKRDQAAHQQMIDALKAQKLIEEKKEKKRGKKERYEAKKRKKRDIDHSDSSRAIFSRAASGEKPNYIL